LIEGCSEKIAKRLIGRTEMEDGLKRLDKLTQEEVRMATAENLKVTHTVDKGVKEVVDTVVAIDDRVARVDDRVAAINDRVASVDNTVKGVDDRVAAVSDRVAIVDNTVKGVDNKVAEVIAGV
jgi:archaellum component FlaC